MTGENTEELDFDTLEKSINKGINYNFKADAKSLEAIKQGGFLALRDLTGLSGPNYNISIDLHSIQDMLAEGVPPIHFDAKSGKEHGTYRVIFLSRPTLATRANTANPIPTPMFFSSFKTSCYVFGVFVKGSSNAPKQSGWISLKHTELKFG